MLGKMFGKVSDGGGSKKGDSSSSRIRERLLSGFLSKKDGEAPRADQKLSASASSSTTPEIEQDGYSDSSAANSRDNLKLALNAYSDPKPPLSSQPHYINRRFISFQVLSVKEQQALAEQLYPTTPNAHQLQIDKALYSYSLTQILQALLATWKTTLSPRQFLCDIAQQAAPSNLLHASVHNDRGGDFDSEDESEDASESAESSPNRKLAAWGAQSTEDLFANINLNAISSAQDIPWLNLILCIGKDEGRARIFLSVVIKTVLATKFFKDNSENMQQHISSTERLKIKLKLLMISPVDRLRNGNTVEELILYGYSLEDIIDGLMECYDDEETFDLICLRSIKLKNDFPVTQELENKINDFISKAKSNPSYKLHQAGVNFNDFRAYVVENPEYKHLLCEQIVVASIFSLPLIEDSVVGAAFEKINSACFQQVMKDDIESVSRESTRLSLLSSPVSSSDIHALGTAVETLLLHGIEDKAIVNCYITSMKYWTMKRQEVETKRQEAIATKSSGELSFPIIKLEESGEVSGISSFELTILGLIERVKPNVIQKLKSDFDLSYHTIDDQIFQRLEQLNVEVNAENAVALLGLTWPALSDGDSHLLKAAKCLLKLLQHEHYTDSVEPLIEEDQSLFNNDSDGDKSALLTNSKKLGLLVIFIGSVLYFAKYGKENELPQRLASIGVNTLDDLNALFNLLKNQTRFSEQDIEDMHALFSRWLLNGTDVDLVGEIISSKQVISNTMIASEDSSNYSKALHGRITSSADSRKHNEEVLFSVTLYTDTEVSTARLHHEFPKLAFSENFLKYRTLINTLDDFICANQYNLAEPLVNKSSILKASAYHQVLEEAQSIIRQHAITHTQSQARASMQALSVKAVYIDIIKLLLFPYGNEAVFSDFDFSAITIDTFKQATGDIARRYSSMSARMQRVLKLVVLAHNFKSIASRASIAAPFIQPDEPYYVAPSVQPIRNIFAKVMEYENSIIFATDCIIQLKTYISFFEDSYKSYTKYNSASNFHDLLDQIAWLDSNLTVIKLMTVDLIQILENEIQKLELDDDGKIRHCKLILLFLRVAFIKQIDQITADLRAIRFEEISCKRINIDAHQHSNVLEELCESKNFDKQLEIFEIYITDVKEQKNSKSLSDLAMLCIYMLIKPLMAEGKTKYLQAISQSDEIMRLITTQTVLLVLRYDVDGLDILQFLLSSNILLTDENALTIDRGLSASIIYYDLIKFSGNRITVKNIAAKIIILQLLYQHEEICIVTDPKVKKDIEKREYRYLHGLIKSYAESFSNIESNTFTNTYLYRLLASGPDMAVLSTITEYLFTKYDLSNIKSKKEQFNQLFKLFDAQCSTQAPLYTNATLSGAASTLSVLASIYSTEDTTDSSCTSNILHEVLYRGSDKLFVNLKLLTPKDDFNSVFPLLLREVFTQANLDQTNTLTAQLKLDAFAVQRKSILDKIKSIQLFSSATFQIGNKLTQLFNGAVKETLPLSITYKLVMLLNFFELLDSETLQTSHTFQDRAQYLTDENRERIDTLAGCINKAIEDSRLQEEIMRKQTGKKNYEMIVTSLYANIENNIQSFLAGEALINSSGQTVSLHSQKGLHMLLAIKYGDINFTHIFTKLEQFAMRKHNRIALNGIYDALSDHRIGSVKYQHIKKYFESICNTKLRLSEAEENLSDAMKEGDADQINQLQDRVDDLKKSLGTDKRIFLDLCKAFDLTYQTTNMKTAVNNRRLSVVAQFSGGNYSDRRPASLTSVKTPGI